MYKNNVVFIITAQGQADYSAAWAAYYQQLYQQQAVMAAGQAPGIRIMYIFPRTVNIKQELNTVYIHEFSILQNITHKTRFSLHLIASYLNDSITHQLASAR